MRISDWSSDVCSSDLSALAAVLLRGPNASAARVAQRGCALLIEMGWPQECRGLDGFARRILARKAGPWADRPSLAAHFARLALGQGRQAGASKIGRAHV